MSMHALLVRKAILTALVVAGIGFSVYLAWVYRTDIAVALRNADLLAILGCLILLMLANMSIAWVFSELAGREADQPIPKMAVAGAFLLAQVGKYVPGRVWGLVMQKAALGHALQTRAMIVANLEVSLISLVGMAGSGLACIALIRLGCVTAVAAMLLTAGAMVAMMSARFMKRAEDLIVRVVGRADYQAERRRAPNSAIRLVRVVPLILAYLSLYAFGWTMLLMFGFGVRLEPALQFVAAQSASQILGVLSMVPAGIGIREVALLASSAWFAVDAVVVAALVVLTRLALVCIDLLSMPLGALMLYGGRRG
ncbi:MAG: hypothetical protein ACK4RW_12210 [Rehaibacterium terrae]|uniref:hypothetical protein n=1 Tax=Rehaibacterium terrae TaxID=1341696 RepID=UPI00391DC224